MVDTRQIMRVISVAILTALLSGPSFPRGRAQDDNRSRCESKDPEQSIEGCSSLIRSGQEKGPDLANTFLTRGSAYARKGDYKHAAHDNDEALRLNPSSAKAFYARGWVYA